MLNKQEKQNIQELIKELESQSEAEIVAVIAKKAISFRLWFSVLYMSVFVGAYFFLSLLGASLAFVFVLAFHYLLEQKFEDKFFKLLSVSSKTKKAQKLAQSSFNKYVKNKTNNKVGMMFFVSEKEKYVRILTDEGIANVLPDEIWQQIVEDFIKDVKSGDFSGGYIRAIKASKKLLVEKFPIKKDDKNELSDEVIELD